MSRTNNKGPLSGLSKSEVEQKLSEDIKKHKAKIIQCPPQPNLSRLPTADKNFKTIVELYGKSQGGLSYHQTHVET